MPVTRDMLLSELKELQRLTAFEQAVATVRRAQAASTPVAQELAENAKHAGERLGLLAQALRGAGGTPGVVGPVLGRLGALAQTQLNQVQTLQGALLGDLALEHRLRDRARYARTLATTLGETSVLPVLDRLESAHTETIQWLERRLAEVGRTGSSAVRATPVQAVVGGVRQAVGAPLALLADGVDRLGSLLGRSGQTVVSAVEPLAEQVREAAGSLTEKVGETAADVQESAEDVQESAEDVQETADAAAETASQVTSEVLDLTGGDDVPDEKAPFAGYERLPGDTIMRHVEDTDDVEELRVLLAFEQAHKARKGVLKAAQDRLTALAASV